MSEPTNKELYQKSKDYIYNKYPKHSAYRSGLLVQHYKKEFAKQYIGTKKQPYRGKRPKKRGLARWFLENWKSDTGKYRYTSKSSVYRPTKRITTKTPTTFKELKQAEIQRAKREKSRKGRVKQFRER